MLTADPARKRIWAIECKSLAGSLGSSEVMLEMTAHFDGSRTSSISKHGERVAWVRERMAAALERLGLHDRDLLGQEWVREGVEQLRHGELIER